MLRLCVAVAAVALTVTMKGVQATPQWLWLNDSDIGNTPRNTFVVFRTVWKAPAADAAATLRVAASSNAAVFLNGVTLQVSE